MATITGPPAPDPPFYVGKGIRFSDNSELMIYGYDIPNYLGEDPRFGTNEYYPYSIVNPTTLFDLSSLVINHEVVVCLYVFPEVYAAMNWTLTYYRSRDNFKIFEYSPPAWPDPPPGQH